MIYASSMQSTNPKYVIFNSTQKRENYRSKCVNSTIKSCQILSFYVNYNTMYFKFNFCMLVVSIITSQNIFFRFV
jgi:hypothetical protein